MEHIIDAGAQLHVLSLEDSSQDFELIRELLIDAGFDLRIDRVDRRDDFVALLRNQSFDIVLADFSLPGFDAFGALDELLEIRPDIPFVCVSGSIGEETAIDLLRRGAADYVLKDRISRLPSAVKRAIEDAQDRKARRRAEAALSASEEKYRAIFENVLDVYYEASLDGILLEISPSIEMLSRGQYHPKDLIGKSSSLFYANLREREALLAQLQEQGRITDFQVTLKNRDGELIPCSLSSKISLDAQGRPQKIIGSMRDISERKKAEELLRVHSAALNAAANAIIITNRDGITEWVNRAFTTLTGYRADEAIGKNTGVLVKSGRHDRLFYKQLWDTILAGEVWRGEIVNRKKDGTLYTEEQTITPLRDLSGAICNFIAIKQDITTRKFLEQQLQEMQKLESVGTLAGGIAHDFNNILAIVLAYATLLEPEAAESRNVRLAIDAVTKAVRRGTMLVRQILTFARKTELEVVAVDPNEMVNEVLEMVQETFPRIITYGRDLKTLLPPVRADHTQLHQVLLNLCVNARDAMPEGGVITVRTDLVGGTIVRERFVDARADAYVLIGVTDTGTGMTAETQKHIFEPFFTTKEKGKGTGLGLSVVFGIVRSHDGFIGVESEPGKGTTFRVYLPVPPQASKADAETAVDTRSVCGGTETILIVEDEELLMEVLRSTLAEKGYHVITAADGLQAIQLFAQHRDEISLVLTDIGLPKMAGSEEIVRIRHIKPDMRIIVTTGYLDPALELEMRKMKNIHFLSKPFVPSRILRMVREILDAPES